MTNPSQNALLQAHCAEVVSTYRPYDPPRENDPYREDFGRLSVLPLPENAVGPELKPYGLHFAYYAGEDEPLSDADLSDIESATYQEWLSEYYSE